MILITAMSILSDTCVAHLIYIYLHILTMICCTVYIQIKHETGRSQGTSVSNFYTWIPILQKQNGGAPGTVLQRQTSPRWWRSRHLQSRVRSGSRGLESTVTRWGFGRGLGPRFQNMSRFGTEITEIESFKNVEFWEWESRSCEHKVLARKFAQQTDSRFFSVKNELPVVAEEFHFHSFLLANP